MLNLSLIHQMLPPKVAEDLLFGRPVLPEPFENSTVFFSNIIGFRKLSAKCAPMKVIQLLNKLYIVMDYCVSLFPQLYKVETIGDVYMVRVT